MELPFNKIYKLIKLTEANALFWFLLTILPKQKQEKISKKNSNYSGKSVAIGHDIVFIYQLFACLQNQNHNCPQQSHSFYKSHPPPPLSKKKSAPPSFLVISTQKFTNYQPPFTKSPLKTFKLAAPPPFPKRTRKPFYTFLCFETFFNNKSFIKWIELKNVYKKPWLGSFVYIFSGRRPNYDLPECQCTTFHTKHMVNNSPLQNIIWLPSSGNVSIYPVYIKK